MFLKYFHRCSWCNKILAEGPVPIKTVISCHGCKRHHTGRGFDNGLTGANGDHPAMEEWGEVEYVGTYGWRY